MSFASGAHRRANSIGSHLTHLVSSSVSSTGISSSLNPSSNPSSVTTSNTSIVTTSIATESLLILIRILKFMESKDFDREGIFSRKTIDENQVRQIYQQLLKEGESCLIGKDNILVVEVFLEHLASLNEALFPFEMYDSFLLLPLFVLEEDQLRFLKSLLVTLPKILQSALKQLFEFFHTLLQQSSENKLDPSEVATIFGPFLLRPKVICYYMENDQKIVENVIKFLLSHQFELAKFWDSSDSA